MLFHDSLRIAVPKMPAIAQIIRVPLPIPFLLFAPFQRRHLCPRHAGICSCLSRPRESFVGFEGELAIFESSLFVSPNSLDESCKISQLEALTELWRELQCLS